MIRLHSILNCVRHVFSYITNINEIYDFRFQNKEETPISMILRVHFLCILVQFAITMKKYQLYFVIYYINPLSRSLYYGHQSFIIFRDDPSKITHIIYTTGKKYGIFFISATFCIFVCGAGYFYTWNTFKRADITFGSLLALNNKMKRKGSKTIISVFFSIRLWLEFFLSLCQFAAISIRVLYWDIVHNTIVYLPPILVRSAED